MTIDVTCSGEHAIHIDQHSTGVVAVEEVWDALHAAIADWERRFESLLETKPENSASHSIITSAIGHRRKENQQVKDLGLESGGTGS
jgi:hypothetical protein